MIHNRSHLVSQEWDIPCKLCCLYFIFNEFHHENEMIIEEQPDLFVKLVDLFLDLQITESLVI